MRLKGAVDVRMEFVADFEGEKVKISPWNYGLIGFSVEDDVAGPLYMNYIYESGLITRKVFDF